RTCARRRRAALGAAGSTRPATTTAARPDAANQRHFLLMVSSQLLAVIRFMAHMGSRQRFRRDQALWAADMARLHPLQRAQNEIRCSHLDQPAIGRLGTHEGSIFSKLVG